MGAPASFLPVLNNLDPLQFLTQFLFGSVRVLFAGAAAMMMASGCPAPYQGDKH